MATIFVAALLAAASGSPDIKIEVVPGRGYAATVTFIDANEFTPVIDRIKLLAAEKCGKQSVRFGRYFFDNQIDVARGVTVIKDFRQSFSCFDPATDPYKPVPADWKASTADVAAATQFVTRFLTYDVALDPVCAAYCKTIMALPAMKEWVAAAQLEPDEIDELEAEF